MAGFALGSLAGPLLPLTSEMRAGDAVVGLASSGLHSNGFSLARQVLHKAGVGLADVCPWGSETFASIG